MKLPLLKNAKVKKKTVFLRADLDVPLAQQTTDNNQQLTTVEDDARLRAGLPTIGYLLKQNCKVIIGGHLGRPTKQFAINNLQLTKIEKELSLELVAQWFADRLKIKDLRSKKIGDFNGWTITDNLLILENLRFYEGEEKNDPEFSQKLAFLADIYVNDAFAVCHRDHASITGVPKFLPHFAGLQLQEEITKLSSVLENPKRPLAVVVGGKKIETKLSLVIKMYDLADYVLVGGKIAEESKEFIKLEHRRSKSRALLLVADLNHERVGILENSIANFTEVISRAKTVIWNGSMGKISQSLEDVGQKTEDDFNHATRRVAQAIIKSHAYSVVGGGDTTEFLRRIGLIDKFNFASTGGGAMLAFLSGEKLPGVEALKNRLS